MARRSGSIRIVLLAGSMLAAAIPTRAAEVTSDRLVNADKEPQNWLMNHRTYDGQRFSPLARINKGNVKGLNSPMRSRSPARTARNSSRRRRLPKTASSTSVFRPLRICSPPIDGQSLAGPGLHLLRQPAHRP
jgi:hypothetical protein